MTPSRIYSFVINHGNNRSITMFIVSVYKKISIAIYVTVADPGVFRGSAPDPVFSKVWSAAMPYPDNISVIIKYNLIGSGSDFSSTSSRSKTPFPSRVRERFPFFCIMAAVCYAVFCLIGIAPYMSLILAIQAGTDIPSL